MRAGKGLAYQRSRNDGYRLVDVRASPGCWLRRVRLPRASAGDRRREPRAPERAESDRQHDARTGGRDRQPDRARAPPLPSARSAIDTGDEVTPSRWFGERPAH